MFAEFFFVVKKEEGFRPCIDYQGLNQISAKYYYPLPLVPSALSTAMDNSFTAVSGWVSWFDSSLPHTADLG